MSYRPTDMGARVQLRPDLAKQMILTAFKNGGANARNAAEALGVTERTFHRHVDKLGLAAELEKIRTSATKQGWLKKAGYGEKVEKTS